MTDTVENEYRQAIVVNKGLHMSAGKLAAQVGHAAIGSYLSSKSTDRDIWLAEGMTKVVLRVESEEELLNLATLLEFKGLPHYLVIDFGRTQLPQNTPTCVGIGPLLKTDLDKIIGNLKLY